MAVCDLVVLVSHARLALCLRVLFALGREGQASEREAVGNPVRYNECVASMAHKRHKLE